MTCCVYLSENVLCQFRGGFVFVVFYIRRPQNVIIPWISFSFTDKMYCHSAWSAEIPEDYLQKGLQSNRFFLWDTWSRRSAGNGRNLSWFVVERTRKTHRRRWICSESITLSCHSFQFVNQIRGSREIGRFLMWIKRRSFRLPLGGRILVVM